MSSTQFQQLSRKAGVPPIRFHDLRHTVATLMLQQGIHPKIVQERLGHFDLVSIPRRYAIGGPGMFDGQSDEDKLKVLGPK